jgi:hypothetical protein
MGATQCLLSGDPCAFGREDVVAPPRNPLADVDPMGQSQSVALQPPKSRVDGPFRQIEPFGRSRQPGDERGCDRDAIGLLANEDSQDEPSKFFL